MDFNLSKHFPYLPKCFTKQSFLAYSIHLPLLGNSPNCSPPNSVNSWIHHCLILPVFSTICSVIMNEAKWTCEMLLLKQMYEAAGCVHLVSWSCFYSRIGMCVCVCVPAPESIDYQWWGGVIQAMFFWLNPLYSFLTYCHR